MEGVSPCKRQQGEKYGRARSRRWTASNIGRIGTFLPLPLFAGEELVLSPSKDGRRPDGVAVGTTDSYGYTPINCERQLL
jgi:hypothetical protein